MLNLARSTITNINSIVILTSEVLRPLPEICEPKILEARFLGLEQLIFAMMNYADGNITLLNDNSRNLEARL